MRVWAAAAIAIVACSGSSTVGIDASTSKHDAAGPPPLDVDAVTVTIAGHANVKVYFTSADGSASVTRETDATGFTGYDLGSGGYVTVVDPYGAGSDRKAVMTWAGVMPRDQLVLSEVAAGSDVTLTIELTTVIGAADYVITALCAGNEPVTGVIYAGSDAMTTTTSYDLPTPCTSPDVFVAVSDIDDNLLATLWHPAVTVGANDVVDLTSDSYVGPVAESYAYSDFPLGSIGGGNLSVDRITEHGSIVVTAISVWPLLNGSASFTLMQSAQPPNATTAVDSIVETPSNSHAIVTWNQTDPPSYVLDGSDALLPDITQPVFDLPTRTVMWTAGTGTTPDAARAENWFASDPEIAYWEILAPYTGTAVQLPPIVGLAPTTAVSQIFVQTIKAFAGYDSFRAAYYAGAMQRRDGSGQILLENYVEGD